MFDSLEIRKVSNGFVVTVESTDTEDPIEYVFDTPRKVIKFVRDYVTEA